MKINQSSNLVGWEMLTQYQIDDDYYQNSDGWDESWMHESLLQSDEIEKLIKPKSLENPKYKPHRNPLLENHHPLKAEFLPDSEGNYMLYPGMIHLLYGKPNTYKSWVAMSLIGKVSMQYWDFENHSPLLAQRLRVMNVDKTKTCIFDFPETKKDILARVQEYLETKPEVLVIDGMQGLARTLGINSDANDQVEKLFQEILMPLKRAGICILLLDHLPKDTMNDDYPIGAQAKKSQCDVSILFRQRSDSQGVDIYITKDRNYELFSRCANGPTPRLYGSLNLPNKDNGHKVSVKPDLVAIINGREISSFDANLYNEVWRFVEEHPNSSGTKIEESVSGKNARIRATLQVLLLFGFMEHTKKGNASHYRIKNSLPDAIEWRSRGD